MPQKTTRYEKWLEAVPDALVGLDQKGVIRFVNRQTESLFGFGRDELIGQHIDTLVPEPLWQIYAEHRDDYFAHPRAHSSGLDLELSGRHRDGTELPINITVSNIDTGDVLLVITALGDGDRRRHVVQNLELTRAVVECSDDAIVSTTPGGIITGWNPAAEKMYGYSGREVIGKSGLSLLPEERAGEWNAVLASVKNGQVLKDVQNFALPRKDGALVPISITVSPIRDQEGEVVGVVSVHRDIREQRQAFEAAQRMAAIVDSSDDAIIGETLDGLVTSWNPAAAGMFGYSAAEIIGRPVSLLIPEAQAGDAESVFARLRAGRQVAPIDTFNKRRDGTVFPISLTASPVRDESGAVVGASVIARDVTEQRRAEEALADASQQYRLLAENASDVVYLAGPDHRVVWIAPSVTAALGWDPEELVGTEMVDLLR
ncbi:MAG TPA: PAS domain S-box protein, partial [Dermatophilaceae bacterium]